MADSVHDACARLHGVWGGASTSHGGEVTEWDSTSIAFTPSDDGDIQVRGFGVSLWRDVHVCFELRGLLTTLTRERWHGVVEKQHIGQYTNSNTYSIQVDLERGEIQGDYAQGVLRLERRHGIEAEREELCGEWSGASVSSTNDPTRWTETHLLFRPDAETPNTGTVVGRGTSLWRRMHVPFEVWGTYDLARFTVHLRKQHTGRYNNMVNFWGTILRAWRVASRGAALEPRLVITGRYSYGDFELSRVADSDAAVRERLDALSAQAVRALLLARDQEAEGQRPVAESPHSLRPAPPVPPRSSAHGYLRESIAAVESSALPWTNLEWSAERLCDALTGIWEGQSVPQSGDVTVWEETALRVRATPEQQAGAAARGELVVSAKGISMWRSHRVEFDVQGTLDPGSGRLRFTKQHKGAFTNSVVYHARVVAAAAAAERGEGKEEEKNGAASAPAPAELAVVGEYSVQDSTGLLLLKRVAPLADVDDCIARLLTGLGRDRASTAEAGGGTEDEDEDRASSLPSRLKNYRLLLAALLVNGSLSSRARDMVEKARREFVVQEEDHDRALRSLGVTPTQYALICERDGASSSEGELCAICFVEIINCVFLPCGHYCACLGCASRVASCPICRNAATVQRIFRA